MQTRNLKLRISRPTWFSYKRPYPVLLSSSLLPNSTGWQSVIYDNMSFQHVDMFGISMLAKTSVRSSI